jgi:hypothetical protein
VREQSKYTLAVIGAAIIGVAALTHQSLWIDEGAAAVKAMQPTVHDWWLSLRAEGNSNLQLLFQLFYLWGWEKIFGASEYALRASNIPWFCFGVAALVAGFARKSSLQFSFLLVTLSNAFLWYYLSEARPYVVLFAFSSLTASCLLRLFQNQETIDSALWFRLLSLGIVGLCITSLIAVPWAIGASLAIIAWLGLNETLRLLRRLPYTAALTGLLLLGIGGYYLWTIHLGARASDVGRTGPLNFIFALYEQSGLSGLGPGRLELRDRGIVALQSFLPMLAIGSLGLIALTGAAMSTVLKYSNRCNLFFFSLAVGLPILLTFAAGHIGHVRLLGRHLMPLLPFLLAFLAVGLNRLLAGGRWSLVAAIFVISTSLASALEIRFAPRHQRDDYRSAATVARQALAKGDTVWWLADDATGRYYGLNESAKLVSSLRILETDLNSIAKPDVILLSKADLYDPEGKVTRYLRENNFKATAEVPAFQIFARRFDQRPDQ